MNAIGPATGDFDPQLLTHPGALVWWYADLVDDAGNGAVVIWSWGLPFLPGIASSARRGNPQAPRARPSLALSVYKGGQPDFYHLKELEPEACHWSEGEWRMGDSVFTRHAEGDKTVVEGRISTVLAGSDRPVTGHLRMEGPLRTGLSQERHEAHSWEPLLLGSATGALQLECGDYRVDVRGRAYHDRNGGRAPLHGAGLRSWRWGRFALPDRELVFTTVEGEGRDLMIEVDATGRAIEHRIHRVREKGWRRGCFGPAWPAHIELDTDLGTVYVEQRSIVDDAPFYQRAMAHAKLGSSGGPGIAERVMVDRLDQGWMRPLVRMRVDRGKDSSMWLPLFHGPRRRGVR